MIKIFLAKLVDLYSIIILIRAVISWFPIDYSHPLNIVLRNLTDPVLKPIRKLIPMGGIDFSPFIILILLGILKSVILGA